ncbi:type IX secretion system sortase PorU, partial [bacterium]|nr:type IX secretion system sortase PorU [bacterium]
DRSLTVDFSVESWLVDTARVSGKEFIRLDFRGANMVHEPGKPQIPYHVAMVGIPLGASVRATIVESDFELVGNVRILPFSQPQKLDDLLTSEYVLDRTVYEAQAAFPNRLASVGQPSLMRDQQVVRVEVAGMQYLPGNNQVRKYNRIVLRLEFVGGEMRREGLRFSSPSEEIRFRNSLLNYEDARKWRKPRRSSQSLPRRQNPFSMTSTFYKIKIQEEGMHRITGSVLESMNVNLGQIDPAKIRLFNNGGRELPRDMNASRSEGLVENAIIVSDGGDGSFARDDFILFYGRGVEGWEYDTQSQSYTHYINHYGFDNIYWLSLGGSVDGKRMDEINSDGGGSIRQEYQGLLFVEEELDSPLRSGLNWFGRLFAVDQVSRSHTFERDLPNAVSSATDRVKFRFVARTPGSHRFNVTLNGSQIASHQWDGSALELGAYAVMKGSQLETAVLNGVSAGSNTLQFNYTHSQTSGQALLDWFEIHYKATLIAQDDELAFNVVPESGQFRYRVSGFSSDNIEVFDITDYAAVKRFTNPSISGGSLTFSDLQNSANPKRYLALNPSNYQTVEGMERAEVRDLRGSGLGAEFIIITHDDFLVEAQRLESLRENGNPNNRLQTEVVLISEIYNNFSGGLVDPVAIRDFLKFAFENWAPAPSYVLLFGDGDYDYKNITSSGDNNWIPPFQTDEFDFSRREEPILRELGSRTTDSWFTYVSGNDIVMDLAIGRLNIQSLDDAKNAVDKIIAYETQPLRGNWRNTITVVGDDELIAGGVPSAADWIHIDQIEQIAESYIPKCFDVEKIYLPEFPKVVSASVGGVRKPAAKDALLQQINKGTLIVNYVGHGNDRQWAHEAVFEQSDNPNVQNGEKFIFFVAATCDWALFDNPQRQSQAEELLLAENRGAIAMLSSARLVFAQQNFRYNQFFYDKLFASPGQTLRIGDAFVQARVITNQRENDEKFHIYGDPTLRLAIPRHEAVVTSINPDSILALNTMQVSGEIHVDGQLASDFSGKAQVNMFDSERFVRNIPEAGFPQDYFLPGNAIYRGSVAVENGRFTARFIVPKDISYGGNLARLSTYFWNEETDGVGCLDQIKVSSSSSDLVDAEGPQVRIYFRGYENFTTGDIIDEDVTLVIDLADSISGINIAGEIGHRLTLTVDPDQETCISQLNRFRGVTTIDLTDLFQFNEDDHLSGNIEFPLSFPREVNIAGDVVPCVGPSGEDRHTLAVKAWDNSNNSTTASVEVVVVHEEGLVLRDVMNYPNPFTENTTFTFNANREAEVTIKIYTVSGQLIQTLEYPLAQSGFNMVEWDGRDADGDMPANGVYLYKLIARSPDDASASQREVVGRIAIVR